MKHDKTLMDRPLASYIDHTVLKPDATKADVMQACAEALEYGFAGVCVNSHYISLVAQQLNDGPVPICVVGFPLGASLSSVKAFEAHEAVALGAQEIDMVIDQAALKAGDDAAVEADIRAVVQASQPALVKVILETAHLDNDEIVRGCRLAQSAGAHFVKTSTGFGKSGATIQAVRLMRATVGPHMGVKASGGIRDRATALAMIQAGASRLGTSASIAIVSESSPSSDKTHY